MNEIRNPGLTSAPILSAKHHAAPSVFRADNMLREARRQKGLANADVPEICLLDPDGDIAQALLVANRGRTSANWACYHTELLEFSQDGERFGVVGCAVGAPFAVLVAEQLFASGCRLVISITSAGQIAAAGPPPYFLLIERALRDEGTSYHYLPPAPFAAADPVLLDAVERSLGQTGLSVYRGTTWTTDAPFRETEAAIAHAAEQGAVAVEMEAAALYAFARAQHRPVICFAHVTNQLAQVEGDFEKGEANGAHDALAVLAAAARAWRGMPQG